MVLPKIQPHACVPLKSSRGFGKKACQSKFYVEEEQKSFLISKPLVIVILQTVRINHRLKSEMASTASPLVMGENNQGSGQAAGDMNELYPLVLKLTNPDQREATLLEMSKKRENFPDLAPVLWNSFGTIAALLQEIISIYPMLSPPTLSPHASNRVCNALALLQCVAGHPDTKSKLMAANIPLYLYPFLNTASRHRPFEYLRLTSLGVIGALVKVDDTEVVSFLLETEIIPLCLRIMETGSELSKTVATFVVQKILLDEKGLSYICATAERFYAVSTVLSSMVAQYKVLYPLLERPSVRLLKHIVRCYLRLSENKTARDALKTSLPEALRDQSFSAVLRTEEVVQRWLTLLLNNINEGAGTSGSGLAGAAGAAAGAGGGGNTSAPQGGGNGGGQNSGQGGAWSSGAN